MSRLLEQQTRLLDALFAWPAQEATARLTPHLEHFNLRGLKAYQSNGHVLAERALQAAYPVVVQMLGQESFADLARALWHAHPPQQGDLSRWGVALPDFLHASVQLADEPYLADVARAEWAMHCCHSAADAPTDLTTLALLTTHDPAQMGFALAPGFTVLCSAWPLASLVLAHTDGAPPMDSVARQLRDRVAQDVLIWRHGAAPCLREAVDGEALFLESLYGGAALTQAIDASPLFDFANWLPMAVQSALVLAVVELPSKP